MKDNRDPFFKRDYSMDSLERDAMERRVGLNAVDDKAVQWAVHIYRYIVVLRGAVEKKRYV